MEKSLRMSSYTIPVKLEEEDGKYMLIPPFGSEVISQQRQKKSKSMFPE